MKATEDRVALVMGELSGKPPAADPLPCDVPGVKALQSKRRHSGRTFERRLYECGNGLALGAKRGGPLDLAEGDSWEICLFTPQRIVAWTVGWVSDEVLHQAVVRLADWLNHWPDAAVSA